MEGKIIFNRDLCIGCYSCQNACKDANDLQYSKESFLKLTVAEKGKWPEIRIDYSAAFCRHCAEAKCMEVCEHNAFRREKESGVVLHDSLKCISCGLCVDNCPNHAIIWYTQMEKKIIGKCNVCPDKRNLQGEPPCVSACSMKALRIC